MFKLTVPYSELKMIEYEAAGNITPVVNLDMVANIGEYEPNLVRDYLENDLKFRIWLKEVGKGNQADSVMLYYTSSHKDYSFVTFVGEPNASLQAKFSEMCGNGIRSLALHIALTTAPSSKKAYRQDWISIWAGESRKVQIIDLDTVESGGKVKVALGSFRSDVKYLKSFISEHYFKNFLSLNKVYLPEQLLPKDLQGRGWGIGLNGNKTGEPHLVLLVDEELLKSLLSYFEQPTFSLTSTLLILSDLVCKLGNRLTFNKGLFPLGINVSIGLVKNGIIYLSTHERNLALSSEECRQMQKMFGNCQCNTKACGTAGAVASNFAYFNSLAVSKNITTVHLGGEIIYSLETEDTYMVGEAKAIGKPLSRLNLHQDIEKSGIIPG